jgi:hypothetical protein
MSEQSTFDSAKFFKELWSAPLFTHGELYHKLGRPVTINDVPWITPAQMAFYEKYGFLMPRHSLSRFRELQAQRRDRIINSISAKYIFYIIYIRLKQWRIKRLERR